LPWPADGQIELGIVNGGTVRDTFACERDRRKREAVRSFTRSRPASLTLERRATASLIAYAR
jgi:hypothetical protein